MAMNRELPAGWRLDENGAWRRETVHSMTRRCLGWDYGQRAIYEITVELSDRRSKALGRLLVGDGVGGWVEPAEARGLGLRPEDVTAKVELTALGKAVADCWEAIPKFYPQIRVIGKRVMPDHFHGLLFVTEPLGCHLGQVIKGFKIGCNRAARALDPAILSPGTGRGASGTGRGAPGTGRGAPGTGRGASGTGRGAPGTGRGAPGTGRGVGLFAEGFTDVILFHDGQLENQINYLADNPRRLEVKALFPELLTVADEVSVALPGLSSDARGRFAALGNRFLLKRPLVQVQVSRRFFGYRRVAKPGGGLKIARDETGEPVVDFTTVDFEERRNELLAAAKHGAVLLSPCVSDGERQIAREALKAGWPLVTMANKGFAKLQKPSGRYFDACAAGKLLMLAPAAWPYRPGEKPMTRLDATAMNRLCQWLAGEDAAEINYHGMTPANVDALAREAARVV